MKKYLLLIFLFLIALFLQSNNCFCAEDKVIAVVNNEVITKAELDTNVKLLKLQIGEDGWKKNQMSEKKALETLIEDRLVIQEAKRKGLDVDSRLIESKIKRIRNGFATEEEFLMAISQQGLSISELRERMEEQILSEKMITQEVRSRIFIRPKDVTEYYQTHLDEFYSPEHLETECIFMKDKKLSENIYARLKQGEDFTKLKEEFSQKGNIEFINRGEFRREIDEVIFKLNVGDFSLPIEIKNEGYFIFLVRNKYSMEAKKLIEVQDVIYSILSAREFEIRLKMFLDDLKSKAYIVIKDG